MDHWQELVNEYFFELNLKTLSDILVAYDKLCEAQDFDEVKFLGQTSRASRCIILPEVSKQQAPSLVNELIPNFASESPYICAIAIALCTRLTIQLNAHQLQDLASNYLTAFELFVNAKSFLPTLAIIIGLQTVFDQLASFNQISQAMLDIFNNIAEKTRNYLHDTIEDVHGLAAVTFLRMSATLLLKISKNQVFAQIAKAEEVSCLTKFLATFLTVLKASRNVDMLAFQILLRTTNEQVFVQTLLRAPNYLAASLSYMYNLFVESDNAQVRGLARGFFTQLLLLECFCIDMDADHVVGTLRMDMYDVTNLEQFRAVVKSGYESYAKYYSIPQRALTTLQLK